MKMRRVIHKDGDFFNRSSDIDGADYNISYPHNLTKKWRELETIRRRKPNGILVRQAIAKITGHEDLDWIDDLEGGCE